MKHRISLLVICFLLLVVSSCSVFDMVFAPVEGDPKEKDPIIYEGEWGRLMSDFRDIPYETVTVEAFDGVTLYARYYEVDPSAPLEIECHGYRGTPITNLVGENLIARTAGRNTLCLEMRATGRSGGQAITFGVNESRDVISWIEWANERFGADKPIILYGISMGAASVLMASALPDITDNVIGVIADCPFSDQMEVIKNTAKRYWLAGWFVESLVTKSALKDGGFDINERTPIEAVRNIDIPILMIHGDADTFVPTWMSHDMKEANPDIQLEIFPGAEHGMSYVTDAERYERIVNDFIDRCLLLWNAEQ